MNLTGISSILIIINLLIVCIKCEFSFMSMLSSGFDKISNTVRNVQCNFGECCTTEYISPDIDSMYIK